MIFPTQFHLILLFPHTHRVNSLCCNPQGTHFACCSSGKVKPQTGPERPGKLTLWELETMTCLRSLVLGQVPVTVNCTCYSRSGRLLLTGTADGWIRLYGRLLCQNTYGVVDMLCCLRVCDCRIWLKFLASDVVFDCRIRLVFASDALFDCRIWLKCLQVSTVFSKMFATYLFR